MSITLVNGLRCDTLPVEDAGLMYGLSVFDTLRTYGRVPFRLDAHLERLRCSAAQMGIEAPPAQVIERCLTAHLIPDAKVRVTVTGSGRWIVQISPIDPTYIGRPMTVGSLEWTPSRFLPAVVKHTNRAAWLLAARALGVDEVLLVDRGEILESNRSSVFAVVDGCLQTPPQDGRALESITRAAMLEAAQRVGLRVREAPLFVDAPFDEFYLASTLKELSPVPRLFTRSRAPYLGDALLNAFRALVKNEPKQ